MAAFPPPFGAGIAFGGTVPSGGGAGLGLNGINDNLPKAPNLVDGGATYNPAIGVTIGGAGIFIADTGWRVLAAAQIQNFGGSFVGHPGTTGFTFTGGLGAPGIQSTGGSGGSGGIFTGAGGGNGVSGTGQGAGTGVVATGGASGVGLYCTGNGGAAALHVASGNAIFTGTPPTSSADPGHSHLLSSANICKAWAMIKTDGAGGVTVLDGYNIASVALAGSSPKYVLVTFARAFADKDKFCPVVSACVQGSPDATPVTDYSTRTVNSIRLSWRDAANITLAAESAVYYAALQVMGRQ